MEICLRAANFTRGGFVPALFCPFSVSSAYNGNVSVYALVSRLGFAGLDCGKKCVTMRIFLRKE